MQIHQLLASLEFGDAVATQALAIQRRLRELGHVSEIFAPRRHPRATEPIRPLSDVPTGDDARMIYHHAFWSDEIHECLSGSSGRLAMIYHNVTPDHFFLPYSAELGTSAKRARAALEPLRALVDVPLTVSEFNRAELEAVGYRDVGLVPLPLDLAAFAAARPVPELAARYDDGWTNFLFVGRLAPNKRQEDVIRVFAWYHRYVDDASRLVLVGSAPEFDGYREDLGRIAEAERVAEYVEMPGKVSFEELAAYYRIADVFVCMSEHEGFCAPLVEAMYHDLPVVARAAGAVPETVGDAGILVRERNFPRIAEAIHAVQTDPGLRAEILARQRERLEAFGVERFRDGVDAVVARLSEA